MSPLDKDAFLADVQKILKATSIFNVLNDEDIAHLARNVEITHVEPNTILLREGEPGDQCYIIRSGEVVVSAKKNHEEERILTTLSSPALFGETSLLTQSPRNATVKAITACELLTLHHDKFVALLRKKSEVIAALSPLVIARSRPTQNPQVKVHCRKTNDGEMIAILKNEQTATYYRLSRVGLYIWNLLDGKNTLDEITIDVFKEFFIFSSSAVFELVEGLGLAGFIQIQPEGSLQFNTPKFNTPKANRSWFKNCALQLTKIMETQYFFKHVNHMVTTIYRRGGYLLFTTPLQIIFAMIIIGGIATFYHMTPAILRTAGEVSWLPILLSFIVFNFVAVALHEMSHALTTKFFGFEVHRFGIGWYWITPIASTDTSDMWLSTRWPRTVVNAAGIYSDMVLGGMASLATLWVTDHNLLMLLWLCTLSSYVTSLKNLDPTLEFDGYYILMDLMDKPNLRESAVAWVMRLSLKNWRRPSTFFKQKSAILYWLACIIFVVFSVQIALFLQQHITKILFPHLYSSTLFSHFMAWGVPVLVVLLASLGIWAEMARQRVFRNHK